MSPSTLTSQLNVASINAAVDDDDDADKTLVDGAPKRRGKRSDPTKVAPALPKAVLPSDVKTSPATRARPKQASTSRRAQTLPLDQESDERLPSPAPLPWESKEHADIPASSQKKPNRRPKTVGKVAVLEDDNETKALHAKPFAEVSDQRLSPPKTTPSRSETEPKAD